MERTRTRTSPDLRSNRFSTKSVLLSEFWFPSTGRTRSGWIRPSFLPESCTFLLPSPRWQMEAWLLFVCVGVAATLRSWVMFLHPSFQGLDLQWMDPSEWRRRQSTFRSSRTSGVELKAGLGPCLKEALHVNCLVGLQIHGPITTRLLSA